MSDGGRAGGLRWNLVSAILPLVGSFLVSLLLAPYVGDAAFGEYSLVLSTATLVLIVAKFGIHTATSRLLTEHPGEVGRWLRSGLLLRAAFTFPVAFAITLAREPLARSFGADPEIFALTGLVVVAASAFEFGTEALVGLRAFRAQFSLRLAFLLGRIGAVAAVRLWALGIAAFITGHALGQLVPALLALLWLLRLHPGRSDRASVERTWRLSLPLALASASFLVFAHTDRLMLGWMRDTAEVGQFAVARNVLDAALFPLIALSWSMRPALVRAVSAGPATARARLSEGQRWALLYAVSAPLATIWLGAPLLVKLYGHAFAPAADLLRWMGPLLLLRGLGAMVFPALLALDAQAVYARWMAAAAVVNLVANLFLIPRLGARGAIVATAVSLLLLAVAGLRAVHDRVGTTGILEGLRPPRDRAGKLPPP